MANPNMVPQPTDRGEILLKNIVIDPAEPIKTLEQLYDQSLRFDRYYSDWYGRNASLAKQRSRRWRRIAIVLISFGGLAPILAGLGTWWFFERSVWLNFGYIAVALAASVVFYDRFWGYSTGWMRFTTTQQALERAMSKFEIAWNCLAIRAVSKASEHKFNAADFEPFCELLCTLTMEVHGLVEQETQQWVREFNSSLQELQKRIKEEQETISAERAKGKTGAVQVKLKNHADFTKGWSLTVNKDHSTTSHGFAAAIDNLPPSPHRVEVKNLDANKPAQISFMVTVSPDQTEDVEIELKIPAK